MTETPDCCLESIAKQSFEGFPQNSKYILEIPVFNIENGFPFLEYFLEDSSGRREEGARAGGCLRDIAAVSDAGAAIEKLIAKAQKFSPDILGLRFNIQDKKEISSAVKVLKEQLLEIKLPLMIRGSGNDEIDGELLPELAKNLDRPAIIASANENTYKKILPFTKDRHYVVLKSPIDINLAKELNILSSELGQGLDKIIIDTDIGGLGCGFEYGYSIIEKIKQEASNDKYLNMPLISFACEETLKTKEAKSEDFSKSYGNLKERRILLEITSAAAIRAAGANLIVINLPQTLKTLKGLK